MTTRLTAELRSWCKTSEERDTFQGFVHNDSSGVTSNGTFVTLDADDVSWNSAGCIVTVKAHTYYLWNTFKRKRNES